MDGLAQSYQHRERPRPSYTRTASRSSSGTVQSRASTSKSNGSSSPQLAHAPIITHRSQQQQQHHGYPMNNTKTPVPPSPRLTTPRPIPQLTRESSSESTRPAAMSAFLQERLQKERQYEQSQKSACSPTSKSGSMTNSIDRNEQSSPFKGSSTNRPTSSSGDSGKKGHGVKEMEQVISGLHKQNFDLKLELYHRRERQSALEDRIEGLESDHAKMQEINDDMVGELEKRDKAIEEAVAMIVTLEAKLEEYANREREMVQKIEADHGFRFPDFRGHRQDGDRELQRMPSFVSDRTENTEHLRNCYLKQRSSMMSLPRGVSAAYEPGLASPSLSVLSESSFVSVYGNKNSQSGDTTIVQSGEPSTYDGGDNSPGKDNDRAATPKMRTFSGKHHSSLDGQSPLQRLEKLDRSYSRRPQSSGRDISALNSAKNLTQSPARLRNKSDKRGNLRQVSTETAQGGARLNDPALPPTPDTMSSATLHRGRRSNDTLHLQDYATKLDVPPVPPHIEKIVPRAQQHQHVKQPEHKPENFDRDTFFRDAARIQRPRSADETTISKRGGDWDSDSDAGGSLRSSLDLWMPGDAKEKELGQRSRSPDLFGFPTSASRGGWAVDAMYGGGGHQEGARIDGDNGVIDELLTMHHVLFSGAPDGPPPPNRRSSLHARTGSGTIVPQMQQGESSPARSQQQPQQQSTPRARRHHTRANSAEVHSRALSLTSHPVRQGEQQGEIQQEKKNYPPLSGHGAARAGLNRLFRRSLGGGSGDAIPPPPEHKSQPSSTFDTCSSAAAIQPPERSATAMGVPSWVSRSGVMDEGEQLSSSATPPPIMRNPRVGRANSLSEYEREGGYNEGTGMLVQDCRQEYEGEEEGERKDGRRGSVVVEEQQQQQGKGGRGRKWLSGFGRAGSLKTRS